MKKYEKPLIEEEILELEDIIAASSDTDIDDFNDVDNDF